MGRAGHVRRRVAIGVLIVIVCLSPMTVAAQPRIATAKSLRCSFTLRAVAGWNPDGTPRTVVSPARLLLLFDSINADESVARLRSGTVFSDVVVRLGGGYLHFMQAFRDGPLYTTTVFDQQTSGGKFRAVHSRHESFTLPLSNATSSPEQYYGECEIRQ